MVEQHLECVSPLDLQVFYVIILTGFCRFSAVFTGNLHFILSAEFVVIFVLILRQNSRFLDVSAPSILCENFPFTFELFVYIR